MNILLAEGYEPFANALQTGLRARGHGVHHAATGPETLMLAQTGRYDAVLMSADMPGFDGPELTYRIRCMSGAAARVPIVACTMFAAQQFTDRCLASGADVVVTEPMGLDELLDLLGNTVRERAEVVLL